MSAVTLVASCAQRDDLGVAGGGGGQAAGGSIAQRIDGSNGRRGRTGKTTSGEEIDVVSPGAARGVQIPQSLDSRIPRGGDHGIERRFRRQKPWRGRPRTVTPRW